MSNRFIRDLTIGNADERRARQIKGLETGQEIPPFRASAITANLTASGPYNSGTPIIVNGSLVTITSDGLYLVTYSADSETQTAGFVATFQHIGGGNVNQSIGNGAAGARWPTNGNWSGAISAGTQVSVFFSNAGGGNNVVVQGGQMTVVRLA